MKFEISREGDENAVVLPEGADLGEVAAQLMALKERESSGEQGVGNRGARQTKGERQRPDNVRSRSRQDGFAGVENACGMGDGKAAK